MTLVEIHKKFYSVPTHWNELTGRQLVQIIRVLQSDELLLPAQVKLLKILTGISWFRLWFGGILDIEDKVYLTEFLLQDNQLTRNVIPEYRGLYGPGDDFSNLVVAEFVFAEQYYSIYKDDKEVAALDMLIATLYRPGKLFYNKSLNKDGDIRRPFNDFVIPYYQKKVSKWPLDVKLAILHWYDGCRSKLVADNPNVFGGQSTGEPSLYGLFSIMRGVADKGVHGDLSKVEKMYVQVFLLELNELVAEADRIEKATKTK